MVEWVEGAKVGQPEDLATFEVDTQGAASNMLALMLRQILRDGFFHGDPHPANILLLDDGRIGLVDFGLAGRLTDVDMTNLTRLFIDAIEM